MIPIRLTIQILPTEWLILFTFSLLLQTCEDFTPCKTSHWSTEGFPSETCLSKNANEIQLVGYLAATEKPVGVLLNFEEKVDIRKKLKDLNS